MKYNRFTRILGIFIILLFFLTIIGNVSAIDQVNTNYDESQDSNTIDTDIDWIDENNESYDYEYDFNDLDIDLYSQDTESEENDTSNEIDEYSLNEVDYENEENYDEDDENYTDDEDDDSELDKYDNETDDFENESDEYFEKWSSYTSAKTSCSNCNFDYDYFNNLNKNHSNIDIYLNSYPSENQDFNVTESNKVDNNNTTVVKQTEPNFIYSIISMLISLILSI
ncbi:hypothetical protein [Methanobrevibacter oralis]|uniref:hypothetical protein n=1 Tax=Methanobrevibacter oralis TaxID=66851 RepID=UPI001C7391FA|nr:hypothetical protein [Methanobrevibacter oralis]